MGLAVPPAFVIRGARADSFPKTLDQSYLSLGGGAIAVRSSAQGEDGDEASFAGLYDTVLNVRGSEALRSAIIRCTQSVTADRAHSYQVDQLDGATAVMNVVVQRMVDARVAGVVFTADPVSARRDLLVIDAVAGLGEALVSGETTPDHYAVHSGGTIVRRQLVADEALLSGRQDNLLAAATKLGKSWALSWMDLSSGRFLTRLLPSLDELETQLERLLPTELLVPEDAEWAASLSGQRGLRKRAPWHFDRDSAYHLLIGQFGTRDLAGFGIEDEPAAIAASGALLQYAQET